MRKIILILIILISTISCGDFPEYSYDKSSDYCVLSFPFAGGIFDRKYVGYFNLISSLQYLDSQPQLQIFIGEPSHIKLEVGSVREIEINDKTYVPEFKKNYLHGELQYYGPAFIFNSEQSTEIYSALKEGYNLTMYGRLAVGKRYETELYNFFFDDVNQPFEKCVNRLLDKEDIINLKNNQKNNIATDSDDSVE